VFSISHFPRLQATSLTVFLLAGFAAPYAAEAKDMSISPPVASSTDPLTIRKAFQLENDPLVSITLRNASVESVLRLLAQKANLGLVFMVQGSDQGTIQRQTLEEDSELKNTASATESGSQQTQTKISTSMENFSLTIPSIDLKNVPLSEAFAFVLRVSGLVGRRVYSSLIISTPERMEKMGFSSPVIKSYAVYNQAASMLNAGAAGGGGAAGGATGSQGLETQLKTIFETRGINPLPKMLTDTRTSTLILMGSQEAIDIADQMIPVLDRALPQVMVEIKLIELSKQASQQLGVSYGFSQGKFGAGFNINATGAVTAPPAAAGGAGASANAVPNPINNVAQNPTLLGNPAGGAGGGVLSFNSLADFAPNFNARLNALVQNSQARVLTTPRLSIQHGVTAIFDATTKIPIVSTTATATSTVQTIQSLDIGERMTITPFIDTDRGIVTMKLIPEISTRGQSVDVGIQAVPEKNTRKVETLLRVRDGESIVIGGLMRQSTNESRAKIPILGDIPLLGGLFSTTNSGQEEVELLIIVTPKIMKVD
jgi:type IV pilus assembly protein PilQ